MNFKQWFREMSASATMVGNWQDHNPQELKKYGWGSKDAKLLTNPAELQKLYDKFDNCPHDFNLYFIKTGESAQFRDMPETGEVDESWVKNFLNIDLKPRFGSITVIFTNNVTSGPKIPMNQWTIAHRIGHAIQSDKHYRDFFEEVNLDFNEILNEVYGADLNFSQKEEAKKELAHALGTMSSARNKRLNDFGEFVHELIAQYIMKGFITLNNRIPGILEIEKQTIQQTSNSEKFAEIIPEHAKKYSEMVNNLFNQLKNKIFVY